MTKAKFKLKPVASPLEMLVNTKHDICVVQHLIYMYFFKTILLS